MNIAVFCSGNGSNFQAIADASKKGLFKARITLMVCDNPDAYAIKRAEKEDIETLVIERPKFPSKEDFEKAIISELKRRKVELICLAGYMRMLSPAFVAAYKNRILNVHPALLPSFKGKHGIKDALGYGVKVTGVTVHFVNNDVDAGPVILQETVKIEDSDTEEFLAEKIHKAEHRLYPEAIRLFTEGKLKVAGRRVRILAASAMLFILLNFESDAIFGHEMAPALSPAEIKISQPVLREKPVLMQGSILEQGHVLKQEPVLKKDPLNAASMPYDKLGISADKLYGIGESGYSDFNYTDTLNSGSNIDKPLTKEEIERMRIEGSIKIAKDVADKMGSMNVTFVENGINGLVDTAKKFINFRDYMEDKYNLHFKIDGDEALLKYRKKF